ncbi:hypothetical protein Drose_05565 [Dactylosporangium roseum]|uniref:Uncharacterized protein n=1 Tax=Dactylosporangium roseum TaxID=47989 RepID=A0ABY5ZAB3_9ACTN|nr:hypothetical protein [Dactylosporangium roseum]UWZ37737.1 hypothetical protein Drose_05565 [Dactylosporangium roseum]
MTATYQIVGDHGPQEWPQHEIDAAAVLLMDGHDWLDVPRVLREQNPAMTNAIVVTVAAKRWIEQGCPA